MQKVITVLALLLALPVLAKAQEAPRIEAFAGYSYLRLDQDTTAVTNGDQDLSGFATSATYNFNTFLGVTADISGSFGNTLALGGAATDTYLFLFGPKFAFRGSERFTPYAHALFGFVRQDVNAATQAALATNGQISTNQKQFAAAFGGGLDVNVNERFAIRAAQADLILTRLNTIAGVNAAASVPGVTTTATQYNLRFTTGVVVKLGEQ
jgi:opacity protein-like surface antigen